MSDTEGYGLPPMMTPIKTHPPAQNGSVPTEYVSMDKVNANINAMIDALDSHKAVNFNDFLNQPENEQALHFDDGKPPMALIPHSSLVEVAHVLAYGANKYGPENWRKGMVWTGLVSSALRHIGAFQEGEDKDNESSHLHLAHAVANLLMLINYYKNGVGYDDRVKLARR